MKEVERVAREYGLTVRKEEDHLVLVWEGRGLVINVYNGCNEDDVVANVQRIVERGERGVFVLEREDPFRVGSGDLDPLGRGEGDGMVLGPESFRGVRLVKKKEKERVGTYDPLSPDPRQRSEPDPDHLHRPGDGSEDFI